jgi:hypothetical protein
MLWVSIRGGVASLLEKKEENETLVDSSHAAFQFMTQLKEDLVGKKSSNEREFF